MKVYLVKNIKLLIIKSLIKKIKAVSLIFIKNVLI